MADLPSSMSETTIGSAVPSADAGGFPDPSTASVMRSAHGVGRFAFGALVYTFAVILFGAVVRITGSGAGCGQHWPTCQGELLHLPKRVDTAIEFTHRLTSGITVALSVLLVVLAVRRFEAGHIVRKAAYTVLAMMLVEAGIGAALVLLRLVGHNDSMARAAVMSLHLVSTCILTAALTVTAWAAHRPGALTWQPPRAVAGLLVLALGLVLLVSMTGAVTALGDTLYPVDHALSVGARLAADQTTRAHAIERLRAIHPIVAATSAIVLIGVIGAISRRSVTPAAPWARTATVLVFTQVLAGLVNIWLSAPGWMQVLHLAIGTALWISLVVLGAAAGLRQPAP